VNASPRVLDRRRPTRAPHGAPGFANATTGYSTSVMSNSASTLQPVESNVLASGVAVVTVRADADLRLASRLRAELERLSVEGHRRVVVDLTGAVFIDSAGLGVLMAAAKRQRALGGQVRIVTPNPHIRRIFELTLLDRLFGGLRVTLEEAIASLAT
jgi:anti-sigma B factor antagonist